MFRLISLEARRTKIRTYLLATLGVTAFLVFMLFQFRSGQGFKFPMADELKGKTVLIPEQMLSLLTFHNISVAIISTSMLARLVVSEYRGKNAILLFSYPIKRSQQLLAKLVYAFGLNLFLQFISTLLLVIAHGFIFKTGPVTVNLTSVLNLILINVILLTLVSFSVAMISLVVGFLKKSSKIAITAAWIIILFGANAFIQFELIAFDKPVLGLVVAGVAVTIICGITTFVANRIEHMEAA